MFEVGVGYVRLTEWQGSKDSNPEPVDLESTALPIELLPSELSETDGYPEVTAGLAWYTEPRWTQRAIPDLLATGNPAARRPGA